MISFRFKNQLKRVKIKTKQKLDQRMSHWLQKVFSFRNQIIGFKSQDNKVYDVDSFYNSIEKFFGTNVDIIQAGDQLEISFTSQNLNSSSFIRPSQPSEINHKEPSDDEFEDFIQVNDRKSFEKKLRDGKDISLLFDINAVYRKTLLQSGGELLGEKFSFKIIPYIYINNSHPKKSCFSIYIGKSCAITFPLLKDYTQKIKGFFHRYKISSVLAERQNKVFLQAKASHQQQDEAPSFTTYHLQQRLNQQACMEYLSRMYREEKCLRVYEYRKLIQKCEQNFTEFYRLFCEGVLDNDFDSFRNQILHKVENNLELILSNVDEMDLSRPISREEQRRNNLKKSVPEIEIVKVENYFEILDQLKNEISPQGMGEIKQWLLDEDEQISGYFAQYLSRQISQQSLTQRLNTTLSRRRSQRTRPISRYFPARPIKSKSVDPVRRKYSQQKNDQVRQTNQPHNGIVQQPPMFGSVRNDQNFSPIKFMSDIESNYKLAENKLAQKSEEFQAQEYGLLYYLLQKRDDSISNFIQQLDWNQVDALTNIKKVLKEKMHSIYMENFTPAEITFLDSIRHVHSVDCVYENFKYESDLNSFITGLKQQLQKNKSLASQIKILHKKSSDSQLLQPKQKKNNLVRRKFSDQNKLYFDPRSPSPKDSEYSLCNKPSTIPDLIQNVKTQWSNQFQQMLKDINFTEDRKEQLLRELYGSGNAKIFGWIRNYIKGHPQCFGSQEIYDLKQNQKDLKFLLSILPIYDQFLRLFVEDGLLTDKIRKWTISEVLSQNLALISAFQLYLQTKQQQDFIETLRMSYQYQNHQMQFYNTYIKRLQALLKQMSINDQVGLEVFAQFPDSIKSLCQLYFITGNLEDMMDTLQVLYKRQSQLRNIKVATLNFSGINTSPFEYHDGSEEADHLNSLFLKNLERQLPGIKKWSSGKIDKEVQKRMSVAYNEGFRLADDGRLPDRQQFQHLWRGQFPDSSTLKTPPTEQQIKDCISFDFLVYLTVLQHVYQMEKLQLSTEVFQSKIKEFDPTKLMNYLEHKKNQPQCRIQLKQQIVTQYLLKNSLDVLFLQQAGSVDWQDDLVKEYSCVKNSDSVIIFKKSKIGQLKNSLQQKYSSQLNFNDDSACVFSEKGYLLISAHLKSSKQHFQQADKMMLTLEKILGDHPLTKFIMGIDANHFIKDEVFPEALHLKKVPETDQVPTTIKKRTYLQCQLEKSDVEVSQVKDLIITNRRLQEYKIETVEGKEVADSPESRQLIPNARHPYDHFIVTAHVI